ncbi:UDP-galactopyranose/dTDP-fucopyranose mutase family protein [Azospirillum sp. sgz302134]
MGNVEREIVGVDWNGFPIVIVGAGFFGATIAERVATVLDLPVLLLDRRPNAGGNSFSRPHPGTGIEQHLYGTHVFHTSSAEVWAYVSRFTRFSNYRHRVFTRHRGCVFSLPINLMTLNSFFERTMTPAEARAVIAAQTRGLNPETARNLEDKAIALIGPDLYKAFIRGYTRKQWGTDPRDLPAEVISRIPVRFGYNDFYFSDPFEGIPVDGYGTLFETMLASRKIELRLGVDYFDVADRIDPRALIVYTGPIDRFYDHRLGVLGWRTLDFELEVLETDDHQGAAVVNEADEEVPHTRTHEFRHLQPERPDLPPATVIMREYSRRAGREDEPYYPINTAADRALYDAYRALALRDERVIFGGRLGSYRYLDMDQAIGAALKCFDREIRPRLTGTIAERTTE